MGAGDDSNKAIRLQIGDMLDRHCKPCKLVKGVHFDKRKPVCDACEIGQQLQRVGAALNSESRARKQRGLQVENEEELNEMREKQGPTCGLTKVDLLTALAAGETLSSIERAWGMKYNTIHTWIKKWELKGIKQEQARQLIGEMGADLDAKKENNGSKEVGSEQNAISPKGGSEKPHVEKQNVPGETEGKGKTAIASGPSNVVPSGDLVRLPRDVADALDAINGPENPTLYSQLEDYRVNWQADFPTIHIDTIMQALVNGYQRELTPEEKAIQWLISQKCLRTGFSAHDVLMSVKNILGGMSDAS